MSDRFKAGGVEIYVPAAGGKMEKWFLKKGNGHQIENRQKALDFALKNIEGLNQSADGNLHYPPYGSCHFAAYSRGRGNDQHSWAR